ncbi:MAG TPA: hypothetical protein VGW74_08020 [Propionibacteriaceae bacterium]|nr:hypothetical protein [Propionibacteriaceae bacterium]
MTPLPDVRPGDVWRDSDPRGGPTVRVERVCTDWCDQSAGVPRVAHAHVRGLDGKLPRTIQLRRLRPSKRGYTLVSRGES